MKITENQLFVMDVAILVVMLVFVVLLYDGVQHMKQANKMLTGCYIMKYEGIMKNATGYQILAKLGYVENLSTKMEGFFMTELNYSNDTEGVEIIPMIPEPYEKGYVKD